MSNSTSLVKSNYLRAKAVEYLWHWIGTPYSWGGDDGLAGWDCSGLMIEILQSVGILAHEFDDTAHGLYLRFKDNRVEYAYAGCLVFCFKGGKAIHTEMLMDDLHVIGASGGGAKVKTIADAIKANAFVKMRPVNYRGMNYIICDPFMVKE